MADEPSLLDNYQGDYKTIDDATAAIKDGTFGTANPYTPGSANYNNYGNPGAFETPKTYPMVQWSPGGLTGTTSYQEQQARDAQQSASNGYANSGGNSGLPQAPDPNANVSYPVDTPPTTPDSSTAFSNAMGVQQPVVNQGVDPQSDGTLHMNVNGQPTADVKVFQGTAFESARDMANQLGLPYSADPKTGEISIGGVKVSPTSYDKNGDAIIGVRNVADALGYKVAYDDNTKNITVTGKPQATNNGLITGNGIPTGDPRTQTTFTNTGLITGNQIPTAHGNQVQQTNPNGLPTIPQQTPIQPWQQPDLSSYQNNMMQYGTFNNDMSQYYTQAQTNLQPTFDANSQKLMDKQNLDLANQDVNMNRRGIFTSGIAEAAANDLRAKTTNAIASAFTAQMAQVEKTAQSLYNDAYKQYQDGNTFALKYNQDQVTNMLNVEKQSFSQYISTQKLDQTQFSDALKAWDQVSTLIQKDAQFQQTNALDTMKALLPYQSQTMDNQANNATSSANNAANNATSANNNANTNATSIANNTANNNLKYSQMMGFNANGVPTLETFKLLGFIPMPDGTLVPTEQANSNSRTYALNLAKELGYVTAPDGSLVPTEQSRHNMATEGLTASGQAVSAANNAANNATSAANNKANNETSAANNKANNETSAANNAANNKTSAENNAASNANKTKTIDSKESYNQSASIKTQLNGSKVKIDNPTAKKFIDANKDVLTDSDYRDLNAWADSKYK